MPAASASKVATNSASARRSGSALSTAAIGTASVAIAPAFSERCSGVRGRSFNSTNSADNGSAQTKVTPSSATKARRWARRSQVSAAAASPLRAAPATVCGAGGGCGSSAAPPRACIPASTARR